MKEARPKNRKRDLLGDIIFLVVVVVISTVLLIIFPDRRFRVFTVSREFFIEMFTILPAVMILMGLFSEFVPGKLVVKLLGKSAGIKGILLAIVFGALPTGPLYIAFPMAAGLLKKGASITCIIVFLSAWACIKIPQELVELQFLGFKFMGLRLALTIISVIFMGFLIEKIIGKTKRKEPIKP